MLKTSINTFAAAAIALGAFASSAFAGTNTGPTEDIRGGSVSIVVSDEAKIALSFGEINLRKVAPTTYDASTGKIVSPIVTGALDRSNLRSEFGLSGGVQFRRETTVLSVTDLVVSIPGASTNCEVSALFTLNHGFRGRVKLATFSTTEAQAQVPVADISGKTRFKLLGAQLKLTSEAAAILNEAFQTSAFQAGLDLGTANLGAVAADREL